MGKIYGYLADVSSKLHSLHWVIYGDCLRDMCGLYYDDIRDIDVDMPKDPDQE